MRKNILRIWGPRKGGLQPLWGEEAERSGRISGGSRMEHSGVSADEVAGLPEVEG